MKHFILCYIFCALIACNHTQENSELKRVNKAIAATFETDYCRNEFVVTHWEIIEYPKVDLKLYISLFTGDRCGTFGSLIDSMGRIYLFQRFFANPASDTLLFTAINNLIVNNYQQCDELIPYLERVIDRVQEDDIRHIPRYNLSELQRELNDSSINIDLIYCPKFKWKAMNKKFEEMAYEYNFFIRRSENVILAYNIDCYSSKNRFCYGEFLAPQNYCPLDPEE